MNYFESLPKIVTITPKGTSILTNIMARASIIQSVLNNPLLYYTYDIQDGDTPEIVAHKYYGSSYYYWVLMYTNQLTDPLWDWPLSGRNFDAYIEQKYTEFDPYTRTHHYEKIITQVDAGTNTTTENMVNISLIDYIVLQETTTTYSLPTGQVTVSIRKKAVSYYEHELNLNESKRTIKILNKVYLTQFEDELRKLMS
jgi:hypothetical protein